MKQHFGRFSCAVISAFAALLLLVGCADLLVVSDATGPEGGLYRVQAGGAFQCAKVQGLNSLVRGRKTGLFYGTVNRRGGGLVVLDEIPGGGIGVVHNVSTEGRTSCHLTLSPDEKFIYTANYGSGDISELRLKDGFPHGRPRLIRHSGHGVSSRQKSPHPHFVGFDPRGERLFVCDLGCDRIFVYDWAPETGLKVPAAEQLILPPGAGPRHLVFSPDGGKLFVANELDSTAASFVRDPASGKWVMKCVVPTLPDAARCKNNYPGAILIDRDGGCFLVTNRGDDSIAVFGTAANGNFSLLATIPSGGEYPSGLAWTDDGRTLAVCHRKSGGVTFFDRDTEKWRFKQRSGRIDVPRAAEFCR